VALCVQVVPALGDDSLAAQPPALESLAAQPAPFPDAQPPECSPTLLESRMQMVEAR
jgi:hypothetical protein